MAYTNKTTHYELPQYVASDKPTYLGDFNGTMEKLDTTIFGVDTKAESAIDTANSASETANNAYELATSATATANSASGVANNALSTANSATSTATSALNVANNANTRIDGVESDMTNVSTIATGVKGAILWSNPNPDQGMSEQNITLSSGDYDILEVFYRGGIGANEFMSQRFIKGSGTVMISILGSGYSRRVLAYVDATTLHLQNSDFAGGDNNSVPMYIVGYKHGLFN